MNTLLVPCEIGEISDGYHTFNELYDHRCTLFLAVMKSMCGYAWYSRFHDDGSEMKGWFICGIYLPTGKIITYHLPDSMFELAGKTLATYCEKAPKWDGHSPSDVVQRMKDWIIQ